MRRGRRGHSSLSPHAGRCGHEPSYRRDGACPAIHYEHDNARSRTTLPLTGIRVLEFCHTIMGPTAGLILADLGADVIKIEPADGDATRRLPGFAAGFFPAFNRNKRSLALDLKSDQGRALLHRLAATADVVLENYAPGTMDRLGCGYGDLAHNNPRLIFCALKGFLSGPYEHRPALDEVVQFMSGLAYMTGPPGQPLRAGSSVVDIMGGMFAVIAIQAALRERERTGRGQMVKTALFEATSFLMMQHMAAQALTGRAPPPMPAREGAWARLRAVRHSGRRADFRRHHQRPPLAALLRAFRPARSVGEPGLQEQ